MLSADCRAANVERSLACGGLDPRWVLAGEWAGRRRGGGGMPRGQSSKHGQAQRCFNEALLVAQLGRRSSTPRHSLHGGKGVSRRHPVSISPQNRRRPLPEGRPASTGPRSSGRSARGRPGAGSTRRTAARSQPPSTLDPSRLGLCSEERAHVSRVRGAVIGPVDMEAGRGSEPARTLARPAWSRLWMVGSEQRSSAGVGHQLGLAGAAGRCPA